MRKLMMRRSGDAQGVLRPLVRHHRHRLLLIGALSFFAGLGEALTLVLIARVAFAITRSFEEVHVAVGPFEEALSIGSLLAIAGIAVLIKAALQLIVARNVGLLTAEVLTERRTTIGRLFFEASWTLQSEERQGHLQDLLTAQSAQAAHVPTSLANGIVAGLNLTALLIAALATNPVACGITVVMFGVLGSVLRPFRTRIRRASRSAADEGNAFATSLTELISLAREIRLFGGLRHATERLDASAVAHARMLARTGFLSNALPGVYQCLALSGVIAAIGVVHASKFAGLASVGAVVLIMLRSLSYGQVLQASVQRVHEYAPYVENLVTAEQRYRLAAIPQGTNPISSIEALAFDRLWFEYEPECPVLRDVSFQIGRGEIVGIIGPSGSGKSTLVQLLLRLREPSRGAVLANSRDVTDLRYDDWFRLVAFVPQESRLLADTVAENIRFFRDDVGNDRVEWAAKLAHIDDEILAMPNKYESSVGELGGRVSGGQRQRLSIARALAGDPAVVVLDEPTSALDARSESLIRETIRALAPEKTVIVIAHRLSTLDICDRIMVLIGGELQGFDDPKKLERSNAFYAEALKLSGLR